MILTFNRSQTIEVKIQKPDAVRAFVFDLEVSVARPTASQIDPMSGMLMNLVDVDGILADLRKSLPAVTTLRELLEKCRVFLSARLKAHGCELAAVCLREKRGFWLAWQAGTFVMGAVETREWAGGVFAFASERDFDEAGIESQALVIAAGVVDAASILKVNSLRSLTVENLGTGEKWTYSS